MSRAHLDARASHLMTERLHELHAKIDRIFAVLMIAQWAGAILVGLVMGPQTSQGSSPSAHSHLSVAMFLGGALALPSIVLALRFSGTLTTRCVISLAQAMFSCLLIHISHGRIETHFHVFASLAFIALYRDWRLLVPTTLVISLDHLVRGMYLSETVFGLTRCD